MFYQASRRFRYRLNPKGSEPSALNPSKAANDQLYILNLLGGGPSSSFGGCAVVFGFRVEGLRGSGVRVFKGLRGLRGLGVF